MLPTPLFVKRPNSGYFYFGTYRQPRYSDRLGYAEMELEVPDSVKRHRANEAGKKDKPRWVVNEMIYQRLVNSDKEAQAVSPLDILQAFQRVS